MSPRWLPILATACGAPLYFPQEPREIGGFDTAADPEIPCSGFGYSPVNLTVVNATEGTIELLFKHFDQPCDELPYALVPAGGTHVQQTSETHVWIARDTVGELVGWLGPIDATAEQTWEITP